MYNMYNIDNNAINAMLIIVNELLILVMRVATISLIVANFVAYEKLLIKIKGSFLLLKF